MNLKYSADICSASVRVASQCALGSAGELSWACKCYMPAAVWQLVCTLGPGRLLRGQQVTHRAKVKPAGVDCMWMLQGVGKCRRRQQELRLPSWT